AGAADHRLSPGTANGIDFVDEDDGRRVFAGFREEIPYPRGADTDDHLHEFRPAHREERHIGLAGHRTRKQRLARARRPYQQHSLRNSATQARILFRVLEKIDNLDQFLFGLVDPGDVIEGDLDVGLLIEPLRPLLAQAREVTEHAATLLGRPPQQPDPQADDQKSRAEAQKQHSKQAAAAFNRGRTNIDAPFDHLRFEARIGKGGQEGREVGDFYRLRGHALGCGRRPGDGPLEASLDVLALAVDSLYI